MIVVKKEYQSYGVLVNDVIHIAKPLCDCTQDELKALKNRGLLKGKYTTKKDVLNSESPATDEPSTKGE